ncbi:glycosyltransferase family 4 protein [Elizabethkingia bruuniana]|uniref:Glycosyltransferase family 4 protein n=1 Tax=Elizabethkingia bruuniana TaxID=1756149 RepID=A0A7T7UVK8_9FLAO|nr:glycosyltransferase family 4 protein [Elizabethkingia bruuniana]KGO10456.1 hypothetical protein KS04_09115 [Elizabethkingia miricola]AQX83630.1 hypothetical protein AYC65_00715 [Elizabethkingia bruuniana]KUY22255.1 hypothetical protein ATB97_13480 [Elizabethkingia bruuniana]OPB62466.1 hypothetical protein BAY12_11220 [Elizabethkingia bruuniana]QDZ63600.1 glycosyltransferase family 4 protein [Elizabethkingia bruuniana]
MKIVYCINNTWYAGGMTRVLTNKANSLAEEGHDVYIITTEQLEYKPHYPLSDRVHQIDLNFNYFQYDQKSFPIRLMGFIKNILGHRKKLSEILKELRPDIVISMFTKDVYIIPGIKDGSKKILEIHTSRYTWLLARAERGIIGRFQNWLDQYVIRKYDRFVILTNEDKAHWNGVSNLEVIPNANSFEPEESSTLTNRVVVAVGRYFDSKKFDDLIRAWEIINRKFPEWKLNIIGDGPMKGALQKQIQNSGLTEVISLKPTTPLIMQEYLNSSIVVLPSLFEGLPMVLLEGQACGVPLVAYECKCGPKDIIVDGENGFLVEIGNVEMLADRILRLIENDDLRFEMGKKAKLYSKRFSEEIVMKKWNDLFQKISK